ncbi:hypothetical protein [Neosynechococcus sphagnicola]|uniref:hypothetical protein n=1 Tax=Neosynechococcus sphagnicola TaxID=1501145 RepID=UPI000AB3A8E5
MRIDIVTLFPDFFSSPLTSGLLGKALTKQIAVVFLTNPRDFTTDKHHRVDDEPYGGGVGNADEARADFCRSGIPPQPLPPGWCC